MPAMKRPPPASASTVAADMAALAGVRAGELHDGGAELDALRLAGEVRQRRDRVRAVGLRRPHRVVAERLGALHELDGNVEGGTGIAEAEAELHRQVLPGRRIRSAGSLEQCRRVHECCHERRLPDALALCHDGIWKAPIERAALSGKGISAVKFALHFGNFASPTRKAPTVWCAWRRRPASTSVFAVDHVVLPDNYRASIPMRPAADCRAGRRLTFPIR